MIIKIVKIHRKIYFWTDVIIMKNFKTLILKFSMIIACSINGDGRVRSPGPYELYGNIKSMSQ